MGIIILVCVFVVLAILGWVLDRIYPCGEWFAMGIICTLVSVVGVIFLGIASVNLDKQFEIQITNYHSLKETIEYNRSSMSEFERAALINNIQEVNESINTHRIMHDSFWTGIWYSEEIGKLELLK